MNKHNSLSSNLLSSQNWLKQVIGAIISSKFVIALSLLAIAIFLHLPFADQSHRTYYVFAATTLFAFVLWHIVRILNPIYCLRKIEQRITWSQICLLVSFGLWMLSLLYVVHPEKDSIESISVTAIGILLGWIFQDSIKSVVAFFYLRANNLLKIDDWIIVPDRNIDGMVKTITLTTVTLTNWETTTS